MVELLPPTAGAGHGAIEAVLEGLHLEGLELPDRVLIEDGGGGWRRCAATLPALTRRRSVIAASTAEALIDAIRLEVGGASWLPVSTPSLQAACEAATSTGPVGTTPMATDDVLEIALRGAAPVWAVSWRPGAFWTRQIGCARLVRGLRGIADRLECIPAVIGGPVLLVAGVGREAVEWACRCEDAEGLWPDRVPPEATDLTSALGGPSPISTEKVLEAIGRSGKDEFVAAKMSFPVMELPGGRRVGRWSLSGGASGGDGGWAAVPNLECAEGDVWQLDRGDTRETLNEISLPSSLRDVDQSTLRLPGWIGAELRRGSPAALLVERLARHEARAGRPIWVPSVDGEGIRHLLGLPGPIWVDGPGVPRD